MKYLKQNVFGAAFFAMSFLFAVTSVPTYSEAKNTLDPHKLSTDQIIKDFIEVAFNHKFVMHQFDDKGYLRKLDLHTDGRTILRYPHLYSVNDVPPERKKLYKWKNNNMSDLLDISIGIVYYKYQLPSLYKYNLCAPLTDGKSYFDVLNKNIERFNQTSSILKIPLLFSLISPIDFDTIPDNFDSMLSIEDGRIFFSSAPGPFSDSIMRHFNARTEQFGYPFDISVIFDPGLQCKAGEHRCLEASHRLSQSRTMHRKLGVSANRFFLVSHRNDIGQMTIKNAFLDIDNDGTILKARCIASHALDDAYPCLLWSLGLNGKWLSTNEFKYHEFLLRILYDKKLKPGMSPEEVRKLLPDIINNLKHSK